MTRELLNTLYVVTPQAFVRLHGEAVRITVEGETRLTVPLHHLTNLHLFGNASASFPLLARCAADGRTVCSFDGAGRFQLPPSRVEAMYSPAIRAQVPLAPIVVEQR